MCVALGDDEPVDDITVGCTGSIKAGDVVVKGWVEGDIPQGLHVRCAKRLWLQKVLLLLLLHYYMKCTLAVCGIRASVGTAFVFSDILCRLIVCTSYIFWLSWSAVFRVFFTAVVSVVTSCDLKSTLLLVFSICFYSVRVVCGPLFLFGLCVYFCCPSALRTCASECVEPVPTLR